jgi:hypothetical protein
MPSGILRVIRFADRLGHELGSNDKFEPSRVLLRSIDMDPAEPGLGPTSPVFQESHVEKDDASLRLMLVGQWAKVHFSGVVEYRPDQPDELYFGIAARVRQPDPLRLASTFTLLATATDLRAAGESMIEIDISNTGKTMRLEAAGNSRLLLAEAGRSALRLQIIPADGDPADSPVPLPARTLRWDYRVRLVNHS